MDPRDIPTHIQVIQTTEVNTDPRDIPLVCRCHACRQRQKIGITPLKLPPEDTASTLAVAFARKIFRSHHVLKVVTDDDWWWNIIQGRWQDQYKDFDARSEFFRSIMPDIPHEHRPDFGYLNPGKKPASSPRRAFDVPQINLEDLCGDQRALLDFILARGQCHPGEFFHLDTMNAGLKPTLNHFGLLPESWSAYTVCYGQNPAETYGAIRPVSELVAEGREHLGTLPPLAVAGLQIQTTIMRFLEDCCRKLLPQMDPDSPQEIVTPVKSIGPLRLNDGNWISHRALSENIAFLPTGELRLPELKYLAEGMILAAEVHICALLESPQYLLEALREAAKGFLKVEPDLIKHAKRFIDGFQQGPGNDAFDAVGETLMKRIAVVLHPQMLKATKSQAQTKTVDRWYWGRITGRLMADAHLRLYLWTRVKDQLQKVEALLKSCKVNENDSRLPRELEIAFYKLEHTNGVILHLFLNFFRVGMATSEINNDLFERSSALRVDSLDPAELVRSKRIATPAEDRVHNVLLMLSHYQQTFHDLHALMDEWRHMMQTDPEAAALVSELNASTYVVMAGVCAFMQEFDHFGPWCHGWRGTVELSDIKDETDELSRDLCDISNVALACSTENPIIANAKEMSYSVVETSPAKQAEKQSIGIEKTCDDFLRNFYNTLADTMGKDHPFMLHLESLIARKGPAERTTDTAAEVLQAVAGMNLSREKKRSKSRATATATAATSVPSPATDFISAAFEKADTYSTADLYAPPTDIQMDAQAAKTFHTIIKISATDHSTELAFEDFVHAMDSIGLECFEMCWPGYLFYPKEDSVLKRGFFCLRPHSNGGRWTARELRALRMRVHCWLCLANK